MDGTTQWVVRKPHQRLHDGDGAHLHELSEDERGALTELIWKVDNVELITVGIDIGSSTSHLMFSRVRLQRRTQGLSSQFVVTLRSTLWRSPILLTPFVDDDTIDAAQLGGFIERCYGQAGLSRQAIDSGAVILTGEAIKRRNAQSIAQLFAQDAGKFVCASAGHHLECVLAAHGSGAVELSRSERSTVLNVDIGGGTTKLALIHQGDIIGTCAIAVGGRLVAFDALGRLTRIDSSAQDASDALGLGLRLGERAAAGALQRLVDALADVALRLIGRRPVDGWAERLRLTEALPGSVVPEVITFSGGVAEYIYGRESVTFGDIAQPLAERFAQAARSGALGAQLRDPGQGIRATVIGASQFSVQLSGKTIHLSDEAVLPIRNAPVLFPDLRLDGEFTADSVAQAVSAAVARAQLDAAAPVALALRWRGDPLYARLRKLADGIAQAMADASDGRGALILLTDGDIGKTLGHILEHEVGLPRPVVSIDGLALRELDFVDIGAVLEPSRVVPIMIKSLLFSERRGGVAADPSGGIADHHAQHATPTHH